MEDVDPHSVLGVDRDASPGEVTAAYRRLAKRHHPDRGGDGRRIRDINAAYAQLRDGVVAQAPSQATVRRPPPDRTPPGAWLSPALRMALGHEILRALHPREEVILTAAAATWDAHDVRLVLTPQRLVWLRDDALTDRVRSLRRTDVREAEARLARRGRTGELRLRTTDGRRIEFAELRPDVLHALERALQPPPTPADRSS